MPLGDVIDENSIPTKELAARLETAAITHPLSADMRDYIRAAVARLRVYDHHHNTCGTRAAQGEQA